MLALDMVMDRQGGIGKLKAEGEVKRGKRAKASASPVCAWFNFPGSK